MTGFRERFIGAARVVPDRFQIEAFDAVDRGEHVVVAAPTGSGKTLVADYAVDAAVERGGRAFYTAPLKALSNQKFRDLGARHGRDAVGLLTGDVTLNPDAGVVVMTTEVLRNMIYAGSAALDDLEVVVLDEVHFLQDAYRGPVWEEVIIHLPRRIRLVCLSATVSNSGELAEWMTTVRGPTTAVVETLRPVRLEDHYLVADRTNERLQFMPTFVDGAPNQDAIRLDESGQHHSWRGRGRGRRGHHLGGSRRLATPGRLETVELLAERSMLPGIVFIFSRAQCDEAASTCLDAGVDLSGVEERERIRRIIDDRLEGLDDDDLAALGVERFEAQLMAGVAAHHAGLIPAFKEIVERCFVEGLLKVVFATETLAVGVNMPARSVVIERTTKYNGDHHVSLSASEFTQLTGRAGRRGIDTIGHAVVLWNPFVRFEQVAALAANRTFVLRSVFRPTYNMAANLVASSGRERARELLSMSFAQFQRDAEVVRLQARLQRRRERVREARGRAESPYGDIDEFRARPEPVSSGDPIDTSLIALRPGDVIHAASGTYRGPVAVVATASRSGGAKVSAVTAAGRLVTLTAADFDRPPDVAGRIELPGAYTPHRREYRAEVGRRVKRARLRPEGARRRGPAATGVSRVHPVESDPDLRQRLRAAQEADRAEAEATELARQIEDRRGSLARDFDAVIGVLDHFGLVDADRWELLPAGSMLTRVFHECDLLVVEAARRGVFDGLEPADLAAVVSTVVFEYRGPDEPPPPWFPTPEVRRAWQRLEVVSKEVAAVEREAGLGEHRTPDPGFVAAAHAWVAGGDLAEVVGAEEMTGGDFVRTMRQVIDLCQQLADVAEDPSTRRAASRAVSASVRGVIVDAVSQPIGEDDVDPTG
jgi:ATP-dependent RNA helicase HelY